MTNSNQKEKISSLNKKQPHNVVISINTHDPYCGGAFPRESDLNKFSTGSYNYLLINTTKHDTSTVKSDSLGFIYLNLEIGKYEVRELYKDMPFAQFQEKNKPKVNQSLLVFDPECYKKWWSDNLLKIEIIESTSINKFTATITKRCFTGLNPCIIYNGELPK